MYALEGISIGFQFGGEATDFVLLGMNPKGARSLLSSKVKLGAPMPLPPLVPAVSQSVRIVGWNVLCIFHSRSYPDGVKSCSFRGAVCHFTRLGEKPPLNVSTAKLWAAECQPKSGESSFVNQDHIEPHDRLSDLFQKKRTKPKQLLFSPSSPIDVG